MKSTLLASFIICGFILPALARETMPDVSGASTSLTIQGEGQIKTYTFTARGNVFVKEDHYLPKQKEWPPIAGAAAICMLIGLGLFHRQRLNALWPGKTY